MSNSPRPNRINIDLGPYKQPWLAYCKARDVAPSDAFRQIVAKLTAVPPAPIPVIQPGVPKVRKELSLTAEENAYIEALALAEGYSSTRWIVALIQARIGKGPQFGAQELAALGKSNLALLAIGRNLNQIARVLNGGRGAIPPELATSISTLRNMIAAHTSQVARAIAGNMERWNTK